LSEKLLPIENTPHADHEGPSSLDNQVLANNNTLSCSTHPTNMVITDS
jgi:hypothetical protein